MCQVPLCEQGHHLFSIWQGQSHLAGRKKFQKYAFANQEIDT